MIYLLRGTQFFLIKEKTDEIIREHVDIAQKNIFKIPEDASPEVVTTHLIGNSLFQERRIIIGRNLFPRKELNGVLRSLIPASSSDNILILQEEKISDEDAGFLQSLKAKIYKCEDLSSSSFRDWLKKRADQKNIALDSKELQEIIDSSGQNLWNIENALEQKLLGMNARGIPAGLPSKTIFSFLDLITSRQNIKAYALYHRMLKNGVTAEDIFWKLFWQYKTIITVASFNRNAPFSLIQKKAAIHPFVIKKSIAHIQLFSLETIKETFGWLIFLWEENKLKTRELEPELEYFTLTGLPPREPSRLI